LNKPRISVVVPHYNDLHGLDLCLAALTRQTMPLAAYEVIVADNMSPIGADAVATLIAGRARLVCAVEKGAGPARNAGAEVALGEILAFTDADCIPDANWLAAGVAALEKHDYVGGAMRVSVDTDGPLSGAQAFELVFAFNNRDYVERKGFTVTANLFCAKSTFDRVGPFKTEVSEDREWCERARSMDFRLGYAPLAVVCHPARRDWPALVSKWRRLQAESFALTIARQGGAWLWLGRAWALPLSILIHAPRILASPHLTEASEQAGAFWTLIRLRLWRFRESHRLLLKGR
jgi:glycosyltransferase involved in cell wall biosynthesis